MLIIFTLLLTANLAGAAQFHATTALEFQNALTSAQGNGQDDTIFLAAGEYTGDPTSGFRYSTTTGDHAVTIKAETGVTPAEVIIRSDNASTLPVLIIADQANPGNIALEGISIENGTSYAAVELVTAGGHIVVSDCIFKDNTGDTFGTLAASAVVDEIGTGGTITFVRNTVTDNKGPINVSGKTVLVSHNTISKNDSGVEAAAETVILTDNVITNNDGGDGAGASVSTVENGNIYITNNTISENVASNRGGGVYVLISTNEKVYFYNNIIWGNRAENGGADIELTNMANEGFAYAYNNDYSILGGAWTLAEGNINADPQFVDPANDDFHLSASSPCIDTGTNEALQLPLTDRDGNRRVFDGDGDGNAIVDMGAYEYGSSASLQSPVSDIQANGSDGPLNISIADPLTVTIALDPKSLNGINADWWVVASTPSGLYFYDISGGALTWLPGLTVTHQGPIFSINPLEILNASRPFPGLTSGTYIFYFGVDMNMNGLLDSGPLFLFYDSVQVNVSN
jgi:hypothetical protein